ncbi:AMIN-like domain-containing (lipo)protein [Dietzia psychralcaliphila]|uniref:AMIN-like domain-containing protein n=1 Tax=Dietzia psychralcaliphila TaxID=139021 RepID=A0AAD0JSL7_9ACTN|nr:hypothetical protein [Dietzia psychralcaliphila]AWH94838.1 hypothetical protein A6048_04270 [Dietzia psychralcaliphila]PTM86865.1 hypothetical protein C8N39_106195 [Dietzia psychralcaliphila]
MYTRHRRLAAAAALTAVASLGLAGCGADTSTDTPATSQSTTAESSPAALARALAPDETETSDPAARPADSAPKSEDPGDVAERAQLVVTEIRVGDFQGKDRVVFELEGQGLPGYSVDYVDAPAQQGSGFPVEVSGDSFLQVMIRDQVLPTTASMSEVPVGTVSSDEATGVSGVAFAGQFEGQAQSVIGLEGSDRAFSAFLLQNPTRLVVDIER